MAQNWVGGWVGCDVTAWFYPRLDNYFVEEMSKETVSTNYLML